MTLQLTCRDVKTLVAALHAWQNELSYYTLEELAGWHRELLGHEPLTIEEVDGLLARLRAAGPPQASGEATASGVSAVSDTGGVA